MIGKFTFECLQFSDVDSPLAYQYGFRVLGVSDVRSECVYAHVYVIYIYIYIHTYIHTDIHAHTHAFSHACVHIHTCIPRNQVLLLLVQRINTYMHTCFHTSAHTFIRSHIHTCTQEITWYAPISAQRITNLVFPSGQVELFARVFDSFGAVSPTYRDTVQVVNQASRRAFSQDEWNIAFSQLDEALMLKNAQDVNKLASAMSMEAMQQLRQTVLPLTNLTQILSRIATVLETSVNAATMTSNFACEVAGVLVSATAPRVLLSESESNANSSGIIPGNSTMDSATVAILSRMTQNMLQSSSVTSLSSECSSQFYTVINQMLASQAMLSKDGLISKELSSFIFTNSESSTFQVAALFARSLISGMNSF